MAEPPEYRGYNTPFAADIETGFRRLVRFELKVIVVLVTVLVVIGAALGASLISRHNGSVTVPDVVGLDNVGAATTLNHAGLAFDYIRLDRASATVGFGHVISTDPPPGTKVKRGTRLRVTFSCGRPIPGFCNP